MNNVVINFEVKDDALESVLDKYARLGIIEKQVAEDIKKTNVEQDKKVQSLNRVVEAEKKSVDINKLAGASLAQFSETLKELPNIIINSWCTNNYLFNSCNHCWNCIH